MSKCYSVYEAPAMLGFVMICYSFVILCVLVGLAVMSVDFGNEFMKIAVVKVCTSCKHFYLYN